MRWKPHHHHLFRPLEHWDLVPHLQSHFQPCGPAPGQFFLFSECGWVCLAVDLLVSLWVLVLGLLDIHDMSTGVTFVWHVQAGVGVQEQREMLQKLTEAVSLSWRHCWGPVPA